MDGLPRRTEGYSPHETCGRKKKLDLGNYTLSPVVLAISHHCSHTSTDSHTPPQHTHTHLSVCVKCAVWPVWEFVWRCCFLGVGGHEVTLSGNVCMCVWPFFYRLNSCCVCSVWNVSGLFWINHQTSSWGFYFTQLQLQIYFGCTTAKFLGAKYLQKYSVIHAVMGRSLHQVSGFLSFPVNVCHEK